MTIRNPILATDSYKMSHFAQYPEGSEYVTSYVTARGSKMGEIDGVVFAGLTPFISDFLLKPITAENIDHAEEVSKLHGVPFNRDGWEIILNDHQGYIPVSIEAVPEGSVMPFGIPYIQVSNTDHRLPWVTSWLESVMLSYIWYMSTVATKSREIKRVIKKYLEKTADNADSLNFKLHDFGFRGAVPGGADLGGMAHLINFRGTDTMQALEAIHHYHSDGLAEGISISATEHSTTTSWGRDQEFAFYKNLVEVYGHTMFSVVIDSYDTFAALDMWTYIYPGETETLYDQVKRKGGCAVMRPDSGDPVTMPCDVTLYLLNRLEEDSFVNTKGYRQLPAYARVIQGDGIDKDDIEDILLRLDAMGISAENIAFGMGGGLLQKVNRDTLKFAMKAMEITVKGVTRDVVKDPITDPGKKSLGGRRDVMRSIKTGEYIAPVWTESAFSPPEFVYAFKTVYHKTVGSPIVVIPKFSEIRERAELK